MCEQVIDKRSTGLYLCMTCRELLMTTSKYLPRLSIKKVTGPDSLPVLARGHFLGRLLCQVLPTAPSSTCCDGGSWIHFCYFPKNKVPSVV